VPVPTLRGPVEGADLGRVLMHEHLFVVDPDVARNVDTGWDPDVEVARAVERLTELQEAGIGTLVDLTVTGLGRDVPLMLRVAREVPVHIVAATGLYTFSDVPMYFRFRSTDHMADCFVRDINDGIGDTGVRAGVLKCATDEAGITPGVTKVLRAVARAHLRTGVPISTHTHAGTERGSDQLRVFVEEGVDPARVVIGHSGDSTDLDYLQRLLDTGATLGMDRFGLDAILGFDARVATVAALCARGYAPQLVLSHDASCFTDMFSPQMRQRANPNWHFQHITRDVLPALRGRGVTEEQIETMLMRNPRRILAGPSG
jgi:phosphotriesterase-related protein